MFKRISTGLLILCLLALPVQASDAVVSEAKALKSEMESKSQNSQYSEADMDALTTWMPEGLFFFNGLFEEGYTVVYVDSGQKDSAGSSINKYGYIDRNGKIAIEPIYDMAGNFKEGLGVVTLNNKYGAIDTTGRVVVPIEFEYIMLFSEGLAPFSINGGALWGYIDKTGKVVIEPKYEYANVFSDGLGLVRKNGANVYVDRKGKEVIALDPEIAPQASGFHDGYAVVSTNDLKFGLINKKGKLVLPIQYGYLGPLSEGLMVYADEKAHYGYLNVEGKEVVPAKYTWADAFSEGLGCVQLDSSTGYVDKTGKLVFQLDTIASDFHEGLAASRDKNGLVGFVDQSGKLIIPYIYKSVTDLPPQFSDGVIAALRYDKAMFGIVRNPLKK